MFPKISPTTTKSWQKLEEHFLSDNYLSDKKNIAFYQKSLDDLFKVDYQFGLWNEETISLLLELAKECKLKEGIEALFTGEKINETENRAVLHTALRDFSSKPVYVDGVNVKPFIHAERKKVKTFVEKVHNGEIRGSTGKRIRHIVNIGIGGSAIGPRMVCQALGKYRNSDIRVDYISSIDAEPIVSLLESLDLEQTLFLIVSKTFTTLETMTNAELVRNYFVERLGEEAWRQHIVGVTTDVEKAKAFDVPEDRVFLFWDWVCGRFSLWSSVGLSIALTIGYKNYEELLRGAEQMDVHFRNEVFQNNIPVLHALLGVWYTNFHKCQTSAIIPYNNCLRELKLYLQQAAMESNGKSVDRNGNRITYATCPVIWGEVGNDAQHSFFQLLHQGMVKIPSDFILIEKQEHTHDTSHQHLLANYHAQIKALTKGRDKEATLKYLKEINKEVEDKEIMHRVFSGNNPVTSILLYELTPKSLGGLLAMYEHTYFVQGMIWNIYSFDQWGVELGKTLAKKITRRK